MNKNVILGTTLCWCCTELRDDAGEFCPQCGAGPVPLNQRPGATLKDFVNEFPRGESETIQAKSGTIYPQGETKPEDVETLTNLRDFLEKNPESTFSTPAGENATSETHEETLAKFKAEPEVGTYLKGVKADAKEKSVAKDKAKK